MLPEQLGIGSPDGPTRLAEEMRAMLEDDPELMVATLDIRNAYGETARGAAAKVMSEVAPALLHAFAPIWQCVAE
eukprot:601478-Alexandrium_andersonii.AAC.1